MSDNGPLWEGRRWSKPAPRNVEWLVPEPDHVESSLCAFRDSDLVLSALEVATLTLAGVPPKPSEPVFVLVGPDDWCRLAVIQFPNPVAHPYSERLRVTVVLF